MYVHTAILVITKHEISFVAYLHLGTTTPYYLRHERIHASLKEKKKKKKKKKQK